MKWCQAALLSAPTFFSILVFFGSEVDRKFIRKTVAWMGCFNFITFIFEACIAPSFLHGSLLGLVTSSRVKTWCISRLLFSLLKSLFSPVCCCLIRSWFLATSSYFRSTICLKTFRSPWFTNTSTWQLWVVVMRFSCQQPFFYLSIMTQ